VKVVITGSEGFLGRATIDIAHQHGATVVGCDRLIRDNASKSYLRADVRDLGQVLEVMAGADAVVHLAAIRGDRFATPSETFRANVTGTHNVLLATKLLGVAKVVLASSIRVVMPLEGNGWTGYRYLPFDDHHPAFVQGEYARSKHVGETIADSMAAEHGLDIVSLRYAAIVDAQQARFPAEASRTRPGIPHYIDVTDAATCTWLAAIASPQPGTHRRCLVTAADTTLDMPSRDFALRHYPEAEWRGGDNDPFGSLVNGSSAAEMFGFEPRVSWRNRLPEAPARNRFWRGSQG